MPDFAIRLFSHHQMMKEFTVSTSDPNLQPDHSINVEKLSMLRKDKQTHEEQKAGGKKD